MDLNKLTSGQLGMLEMSDLSLAFLLLAGKMSIQELPQQLQELREQDWEFLVGLLSRLEMERLVSRVH
jgi:hypothetical protein